jgi:uncharacterized protein YndB with AHSA1/START domain
MGQTQTVQREVEIARPPEQVHRVLVDFPKWQDWNTGMIISLLDPKKSPEQLQPGDKLKSDLKGTITYPVVAVSLSSDFWNET